MTLPARSRCISRFVSICVNFSPDAIGPWISLHLVQDLQISNFFFFFSALFQNYQQLESNFLTMLHAIHVKFGFFDYTSCQLCHARRLPPFSLTLCLASSTSLLVAHLVYKLFSTFFAVFGHGWVYIFLLVPNPLRGTSPILML
jgi:hypothetical protein